jgi:hypothetical protein
MARSWALSKAFVDDVGRGRIREVRRAADIGGHGQQAARLECLKRAGRNEAVHTHYLETGLALEARAHLAQVGDMLRRDAGGAKACGVSRVRAAAQTAMRLAHHEAPHRLVPGRVGRVVLFDDVLAQMRRNRGRRAHGTKLSR